MRLVFVVGASPSQIGMWNRIYFYFGVLIKCFGFEEWKIRGRGAKVRLSEFELKVEGRTVFGFVFILLGVVVILFALFQASLGVDPILNLMGTELTDTQAFVEIFGWFFMLLIEVLGGYFLASIGVKVYKK